MVQKVREKSSTRKINNHDIVTVETTVAGGEKNIVIFCHGYRSSSIGPNRFFVRAARKLAENSISSIRFDQYGSGNSAGDFIESSFNDWVETTKTLCYEYLDKGYRVCLFGQSMGGSTVIATSAQVSEVTAVVAWVPDGSISNSEDTDGLPYYEECGQRVGKRFWQEARNAKVAQVLSTVEKPVYIVQCSNDEYITKENQLAIIENARNNHTLEMYEEYPHSKWTYDQATAIIDKSVQFIVQHMAGHEAGE